MAMGLSLAVAIVMLLGKLAAYILTNSMVILADAAESIVHLVATGFSAFCLWYAARPADSSHPYGHGRIAYFSVGFEALLVLAMGMAIIFAGVVGLIRGPELAHLHAGLLIAGVLATVNLALGTMLIRVGRRHNSLVLVANGKHVLTDVWTTGAAILGLTLVVATGLEWLDAAAAICVGCWVVFSGWRLIRQAIAGLMDELDPALAEKVVGCCQESCDAGLITGFHQLRCRSLNDETWVDVHVQVDGDLSVVEAHSRATQVEARIRRLLPNRTVHVSTHIEPEDHHASHPLGHEPAHDPLRPDID